MKAGHCDIGSRRILPLRGVRRAIEILAVALLALFLSSPAFGQTPQANAVYDVTRLLEIRPAGGVIGFNRARRPQVETFSEALAEKVRAFAQVERVEKYLYIGLVDQRGRVPFSIIGGNPPLDTLRVDCHNVERVRIVEGRGFREEDRGKPVALLGLALASKYAPAGQKRVPAGSTLTLPLPKGEALGLRVKSPNLKVRVIGIFSTGFGLGDNQVLLPLDTAQSLFGL